MAKVVDLKELEGLIEKKGGRATVWNYENAFGVFEKIVKQQTKTLKPEEWDNKFLILGERELKNLMEKARGLNWLKNKENANYHLVATGKEIVAWFIARKIHGVKEKLTRNHEMVKKAKKNIRTSEKKVIVAVPLNILKPYFIKT